LIDGQLTKKIKILFLAPHLSTGGMPGFLLKRIQSIKKYFPNYELFVVEFNNLSNDYVVQKTQIKNSIPTSNFFTLGENKLELIDIIKNYNIDIVHVDEMIECLNFDQTSPPELMNELYRNDRSWRVVETCHNVSFQPHFNKIFNPDAYAFCSPWHVEKTFSMMKSHSKLIEFPIEPKFVAEKEKSAQELINQKNIEKATADKQVVEIQSATMEKTLKLQEIEVLREMIKKWDGKLPQFGGDVLSSLFKKITINFKQNYLTIKNTLRIIKSILSVFLSLKIIYYKDLNLAISFGKCPSHSGAFGISFIFSK
jgi:hypothetical protein